MKAFCLVIALCLGAHSGMAQVISDSVTLPLESQASTNTGQERLKEILVKNPQNGNAEDIGKNLSDPSKEFDFPLQISSDSLREFQASPQETKPSDFVYVIHITHWAHGGEQPTTILRSSRWYVYRYHKIAKDKGTYSRIDPADIYRTSRVNLISIEYGAFNLDCDLPKLDYTVNITKKTPANNAALSALFAAVLGVKGTTAETPKSLTGSSTPTPQVFVRSASYSIDSSKTPLPFAWAFTMTASLAGNSDNDSRTDCNHLAKSADKSKCTVTQAFTSNEAEFWNVGINIIPHGPRENIYSQSTTNTITQKHTFHSPLVAVVDINPFAHVWSMNKRPYLQAGLPLTGAAFHLPYVGVAFPLTGAFSGLKKIFPVSFSICGGVMFMQQTYPKTLQVGQTATTAIYNADLRTDRALKPVFGIEVPLGAIVGKIKGATFK